MQQASYVFAYNGNNYKSGTKFIYSGKGIYNNTEVVLNNVEIIWLYDRGIYEYFSHNNQTYKCLYEDFIKGIICTTVNSKEPNREIIWSDNMVSNTIWYIIIMLFATIFNDRIGIWILATIIWYCSTFKKNK